MNIIFIIHVLLFIIALVIPFTNDKEILEFYSLVVPFLFFHWATNDDTCILTQIEMNLTGNVKDQTFFGRLMKPIYTMEDSDADKVPKFILFMLWFIVQVRLERIPGLNKMRELLYK